MELQQRSYELQSLATSLGEMQQVWEVWEVWMCGAGGLCGKILKPQPPPSLPCRLFSPMTAPVRTLMRPRWPRSALWASWTGESGSGGATFWQGWGVTATVHAPPHAHLPTHITPSPSPAPPPHTKPPLSPPPPRYVEESLRAGAAPYLPEEQRVFGGGMGHATHGGDKGVRSSRRSGGSGGPVGEAGLAAFL